MIDNVLFCLIVFYIYNNVWMVDEEGLMLCIKIPCWFGIAQASLTLLSLRCGIVNCEL